VQNGRSSTELANLEERLLVLSGTLGYPGVVVVYSQESAKNTGFSK
jgi:hypothetical protein